MFFKVARPTPKIPSEVIANMKMVDFVGTAGKPKYFRKGNQILSLSYKEHKSAPIFHSQNLKEKVFGKSSSNLDISMVNCDPN